MKGKNSTVKNVCLECEYENTMDKEKCASCGFEFNAQEAPDKQEEKECCLYCKEAEIENYGLYAEINDEALGHGFICKECFDNLPNEEKISAKILEKHLQDKAHDEEFMESIVEKPLTPEQAAKRKKDLTIRLESLEKQEERFSIIGELSNNEGLLMLLNDVKVGCHNEIDNEDVKEAKITLKDFEAILTFRQLVNSRRVEAKRMRDEMKDIEIQIDKLGAVQLPVWDNKPEESDSDLVEEISSKKEEPAAA